jgi:hypothetical protein
MERAMDTEQATSEKFRKLVQHKRGRLRVKAFADAVDMLSEICREHRWHGSVIRYDGECHALEGSPEGKGSIGFKRVRSNKAKEETLHITKGLVEEICREYNFYGLFVRYDGQFAFLESGPEPKPSNVI